MIPACPSRMCSFNRVILKALTLQKCVYYVCFVSCLYEGWFCGLTSEKVYMFMRIGLKCTLGYDRV